MSINGKLMASWSTLFEHILHFGQSVWPTSAQCFCEVASFCLFSATRLSRGQRVTISTKRNSYEQWQAMRPASIVPWLFSAGGSVLCMHRVTAISRCCIESRVLHVCLIWWSQVRFTVASWPLLFSRTLLWGNYLSIASPQGRNRLMPFLVRKSTFALPKARELRVNFRVLVADSRRYS